MLNQQKKYWFFIYPYVFVSYENQKKILLYNTQDGQNVEFESEICKELIIKVYDKLNLGVVLLDTKYIQDSECNEFILTLINKRIGNVLDVIEGAPKPIKLVPILNLQRDIDRLKADGEMSIGVGLMNYLTEINIYINGKCNINCPYCNDYYKQAISCTRSNDDVILSPKEIKNIFYQIGHAPIGEINLLGGDISAYPFWKELHEITEEYKSRLHYWLHFKQIKENGLFFKIDDVSKISVIVNFPVNEREFANQMIVLKMKNNVGFHFFVENELHYNMVEKWVEEFKIREYHIIPFYTDANLAFFQENVFLEKTDIFSEIVAQRTIFCNQKLNSNFFGKLYIFPNGSVKASTNTEVIGNIYNDSVLKSIYNEMDINTAWRRIRDEEPCNLCLCQYLCPSPSNYEAVIGKTNLCHVKP